MLEREESVRVQRQALAATVAVATSTVMWQSGELSLAQYASAMVLANGLSDGTVELSMGLRLLMGLWMSPVLSEVPVGLNGYGSSSH